MVIGDVDFFEEFSVSVRFCQLGREGPENIFAVIVESLEMSAVGTFAHDLRRIVSHCVSCKTGCRCGHAEREDKISSFHFFLLGSSEYLESFWKVFGKAG